MDVVSAGTATENPIRGIYLLVTFRATAVEATQVIRNTICLGEWVIVMMLVVDAVGQRRTFLVDPEWTSAAKVGCVFGSYSAGSAKESSAGV